jgi:hypothetical protein
LYTVSQLATSIIALALTSQKRHLKLWERKGNGYTTNIFITCVGFMCKVDYVNDTFIYTPTYTYNEVMRLLELASVVECVVKCCLWPYV